MNFRRWLFAAWMLGSILWAWTYYQRVGFHCFFRIGALGDACEYWGDTMVLLSAPAHIAAAVGVPVVILAIGAAILWVIRRLQRDPSSN